MVVVLCWELGGGYGHLVPLGMLARQFLARGHQVHLLCHDAHTARQVLKIEQLVIHQVERVPVPERAFPHSWNYADNLWRNGYWHGPALQASLLAWRQHLLALQPDLLLVEHAPTALLASRDFTIPRLAIGMGFTLPPCPDNAPMPALPPWFPLPPTGLFEREARWVEGVNRSLEYLGWRPLERVADLFANVRRLLCAWPELDHYAERTEPELRWYGPLSDQTRYAAPSWPAKRGQRHAQVFVFMDAQHPLLAMVLTELARRDCSVLAFVRGSSGPVVGPVVAANIDYLDERVCLWQTAAELDWAVVQGGFGSLYPLLLEAVPVFVCPLHLEQAVLGARLKARGLAAGVSHLSSVAQAEQQFSTWLDGGPSVAPQLLAFRERYRSLDPRAQLEHLVEDCLACSPGN